MTWPIQHPDGRLEAREVRVGVNATIPTVIAFPEADRCVIGDEALGFADDPDTVMVERVKMNLGNPEAPVYRVGKTQLTVVEVTALFLAKLVHEVGQKLQQPSIKRIVLTVPAKFSAAQRQALLNAAAIAGLEVLELPDEPTAAVLTYDLPSDEPMNMVVYDLGAGTFDVSVVRREGNRATVLATGGNPHLGGRNFDERLLDWILSEWKKTAGPAAEPSDTGRRWLTSRTRGVESIKQRLDHSEQVNLLIPRFDGSRSLKVTVTAATFQSLVRELVEETITRTTDTIQAAGLTTEQIDKVLFVGGMTRCPFIQQQVAESFGAKVVSSYLDEYLSVAKGAALIAASFAYGHTGYLFNRRTNHNIRYRLRNGMRTVFRQDVDIPAQGLHSGMRRLHLLRDVVGDKGLWLKIFQDEQEVGMLRILTTGKEGDRVEVTFGLDRNQTLSVDAEHLRSGVRGHTTLRMGLSDAEISASQKKIQLFL